MYTSCVRTGIAVAHTAVAHRLILRVQVVALTECCVAVAGATARGAVVSLIVASAIPTSLVSTADSASFCLPSNRLKAT